MKKTVMISLIASAALALAVAVATTTAVLVSSALPGSAPTGSALAGLAAAAPGQSAAPVNTVGFPSGGTNPGIFTDTCKLVHTAPNDPILMPGMTGSSMQHDFYGTLEPSATITPAKIVGTGTSCTTAADSSSYWTPVLYQNGKALTPKTTLVYWRARAATASAARPMPAGITMIAGNEAAEQAQNAGIIGWTCSVPRKGGMTSQPRDCASGSIRLVATFPNCWDGHSLNGHNQKNVVYASADGCPAAYPVLIPQVVLHVNYPTGSAENLTLSVGPNKEGSILTGHADFMDGWNQTIMNADTAACVTAQTRCGPVSGPSATPAGARQ